MKNFKIKLLGEDNWHGVIVLAAESAEKAKEHLNSKFISKMTGWKVSEVEEIKGNELYVNYFKVKNDKTL